jgi:Fe-S-cluster containining protein
MDKFKRTTPHKCQQCGMCCQNRGDLWGDEESWPTDTEPDHCTAFDKDKCSCNVYDDRRDFCREYPWDEWCERELREKGLWEEYKI